MGPNTDGPDRKLEFLIATLALFCSVNLGELHPSLPICKTRLVKIIASKKLLNLHKQMSK